MPNTNAKIKSATLQSMKDGFVVGFPIILGYFPIAIAYGVLAKQAGLSLIELTLMSAFVYAGASQFMAVNMIAVGAGASEVIIATFVLNFRHFIMSLSFMNKIKDVGTNWKVPISFGLTDETFAVASLQSEEVGKKRDYIFYITLMVAAYLSWVLGSLLGGLLGEVIPDTLSQSMGIALYAMFIGLLVPSVKRELKFGFIALIAMLINAIFSQYMGSGWAIVTATILGGLSGIYFLREDTT